MLEVRNLSKKYDRIIFKNLNITFPRTGFILIKGDNGTGKSTFLNIISGLENASEGKIFYENKELVSKEDFLKFRKEKISFIFQDYGLIDHLSIYQNLLLGSLNISIKDRRKKMMTLLKKLNVNKSLDDKCINLSGGEKQRIAIARSLLSNKEILLCDEPTGSLDYKNACEIYQILKEISKEMLVICVSHDDTNLINNVDDIFDFNNKEFVYNYKNDKNILKPPLIFEKPNYKDCFKLSYQTLFHYKNRTILSLISSVFVLICLLITIMFSTGIDNTLSSNIQNYVNYNMVEVSKSEKSSVSSSGLSFIKKTRPDYYQITSLLRGEYYELDYSFDGLFNEASFTIDNQKVALSFKPFKNLDHTNYDYLKNKITNYRSVFANSVTNLKQNQLVKFSLGKKIQTTDQYFNRAYDYIEININFKIEQIIDEFSFMNVPTIYYDYELIKSFLENYVLENASYLLNYQVNLFDRVSLIASPNENLSSYHFLLWSDKNKLPFLIDVLTENGYDITSFSLEIKSSLEEVFHLCETFLYVFIFISFIILFFLIGLIIYSMVVDRKREIGILSSSGISDYQIKEILSIDGVIICFLSVVISLLLLPIIIKILNYYIYKYVKIKNLLKITFDLGLFKYDMFFLIVFGSILCGKFVSILPLYFSLKNTAVNNMRLE